MLSIAAEAAYLAGRRTLSYFNTGVAVEIKDDNTPVTMADREAEQVIRSIIARHYPTHTIIGEEMGHTPGHDDYRWIIDPIDGTKSFIHGVPLYGVLVGVEVKGRPSVGVCYHPATDEMVTAADGLGCHWNGRPARVSTVSKLSSATLLCTSPPRAQKRSDAFDRLEAEVGLTRSWGDCYGYTLIATGRAEIMLDPRMNPWDCAPLLPILREAGGYFTTWKGEATIYGPDAVATNAALHEQVLNILKSEVRRNGGKSSEDRAQ
jgi:histidinol phosphatase-like enzyme (inositol monophosphatase family)